MRGLYPGSGSATNDWCSRTVTASGDGVTSRTNAPVGSPVKVSVVSISVFLGKPLVSGR